ncbi:MAG: hypothetical protein QXV17_07000 [Candidatus Micrarchaeaceae archaeon]
MINTIIEIGKVLLFIGVLALIWGSIYFFIVFVVYLGLLLIGLVTRTHYTFKDAMIIGAAIFFILLLWRVLFPQEKK